MAETKQCPDCAEQVLAQARKCRYCGYRFDRRRRDRSSPLGDLLRDLRKDTKDVTLPEVLADWGVSLEDGEEVQFFRPSEVDGRPGYLLVTAVRLVFFAQHGRSQHDKLFEHPLASVSQTRIRGCLGRRRLELSGPAFDHVALAYSRDDVQLLAGCLAGHRSG
jgi:hypothetical protein